MRNMRSKSSGVSSSSDLTCAMPALATLFAQKYQRICCLRIGKTHVEVHRVQRAQRIDTRPHDTFDLAQDRDVPQRDGGLPADL